MLDSLLIDRLIGILEKEVETYNRFLELSRRKTEIIINGDIVELEDITKKEYILTNEMSKFEEMREQIMAEIIPYLVECPLAGEESSGFTITSIIEFMKKKDKTKVLDSEKHYSAQIEKLEKCKEIIIAIVNELKGINKINADLINNSLEYINFSINLITSVNGYRTKYSNDGKEGKVERHSLFDVKL